jgi:hypothetical protein
MTPLKKEGPFRKIFQPSTKIVNEESHKDSMKHGLNNGFNELYFHASFGMTLAEWNMFRIKQTEGQETDG